MSGADVRMHPHLLAMKPAKRHLFRGQWLSVPEIAELTGIPKPVIYARMKRGQPVDEHRRGGRTPKRFLFRDNLMTIKEISRLTSTPIATLYSHVSGERVLEGDELKDPYAVFPGQAHLITFRGKTNTKQGWAAETGIPHAVIETRLRRGWSIKRTLTEPAMHPKVRGTRIRNRHIITRLTIGFSRTRNQHLIQRMVTAFRTGTRGYVQTSHSAKGTGVGRHAPHLHQENFQ